MDFQEKVWKPIHDTIIIFETGGIRNYIHQYPKAKYSFNLWAQEYLQKKGYLK